MKWYETVLLVAGFLGGLYVFACLVWLALDAQIWRKSHRAYRRRGHR